MIVGELDFMPAPLDLLGADDDEGDSVSTWAVGSLDNVGWDVPLVGFLLGLRVGRFGRR